MSDDTSLADQAEHCAQRERLTDREWDFVLGMRTKFRNHPAFEPSLKQAAWLRDIYRRLKPS